ncbi:MAG: methyltransferase domain-containing protein [Bacteroidia bacterium]
MTENYFKSCLLCNATQLQKLDAYAKDYLVKCSNCGFVFSIRIPTYEELTNFYNQYPINEPLSPITVLRYDEWLNEFEKYRVNNNIIDIGCGNGYFLDRAKAKGWNVYGTEFTQRQVDIATAKGINMSLGGLDVKNYQPGFFDVIVSIEVMEHINNPNEELQRFSMICRKGGAVYITTPNFDALSRYYFKNHWNIFAYPEHLCYYTKKTLSKLFKQNGFKKDSFLSTGISLKRYKQSATGDNSTAFTVDETVRQQAEERLLFKIAKKTINFFLTLTNKGDTLKGLFVKE